MKPKSFHLQWHITERCNFNCKHCYKEKEFKELDLNNLISVLHQYIEMIKIWELDKNKRSVKLSITGGEPFLRNDFFDLIEKINENREIFTSVVIMSNGSFITKSIVKKLKDYNISGVQISLEGTEDINDKIRGKGSFKKAVKAIKILMKEKISVGVSVTVHKENYKDFENLLKFLIDIGVKSIGISRFVPVCKTETVEMLEPYELKEFYSFVMNKKNELAKDGINISTHCSDSLFFIENEKYDTHGCSAGYDSLSILPNGDVVPCRRLPIKVGNILEKSLFDIWYSSKKLESIRNKGNIVKCSDCELFSKCFGGARCVAYGHFNDCFAPDPQCWKLFNSIIKKSNFKKNDNISVQNEKYLEPFDPEKYFRFIGKS
ncbi:MAG: radical SAM protein [Candidatus Aenigmarchaeota archaeon]|nr:radical SAM protein [Candidatus Aenigmarchaeota archaeon]